MNSVQRCLLAAGLLAGWATAQSGFTIQQVMDSPFPTSLVASGQGEHVAWTADLRGVRNVFVADGPNFAPRQLTHYTLDDGQPIASVRISPDGKTVVYARGSEHNAVGDTADPDSAVAKPEQEVWAVSGGAPKLLGELGCGNEDCEDIEMSPDGHWVVWPARNTIWIAPTSGAAAAKPLTWAQGNNLQPHWSPDSKHVAFVSQRPGHSLIAIYDVGGAYLRYLAPSVDRDSDPRWSPDGREIVFVRQRGLISNAPPPDGPEPATLAPPSNPQVALPHWELWAGDAQTLLAHRFWQSGTRPEDALYGTTMGEALRVGADHRVLFSSEMDGWNHLYSVSDVVQGDAPNTPKLLTPGEFEIENVALLPGGAAVVFSSNQDDIDRRHPWRVPLDGSTPPAAITRGDSIEWSPVVTADGKKLLCLGSGPTSPAMPYSVADDGTRTMIGSLPADFPAAQLVAPKQVIFPSTDGLQVHGQLFEPRAAAAAPRPTLIFVHGGSRRQMVLGFHYMDYYHNAYAENEYLASLGFNVLSVNYRTGIMYGRAFRMAPHTGRQGGKEYDDVVAAAKYLQTLPEVDGQKIGIWGGSYGGYLTAMALSHNSDIFKAGVDYHGVHDWSTIYAGGGPPRAPAAGRGGRGGNRAAANGAASGRQPNLAFDSSPDAYVANWRSPVLLIQGDDDRNVDFGQMIDLVGRLRAQQVPFEQMVLPDEIHGFLRWSSWVRSYAATADFFQRVLQQGQAIS
ncbi:MAG: S9 family peptidase, partial [Terriglobales bacterium]